MILMKKLISVIMILVLILQMEWVRAEELHFLTTDTFESCATGSIPYKATAEGANVAEVVKFKDKACEMSSNGKRNSLVYSFGPTGGKVSLSFDILYKKEYVNTTVNIGCPDGSELTLVTVKNGGSLYTADGKKIATLPKNKVTRLGVSVDAASKKIWVYNDGRTMTSARYTGENFGDIVSYFGVQVSGKRDASVLVDNVAICRGTGYVKANAIPREKYNFEIIEITDEAQSENNTVYLNRSFDEDSTEVFNYFTLTPYDNTIEVKDNPLSDSKYLHLVKLSSQSCRFVVKTGASASANIIAQADFSTENDITTDARLFTGNDGYHYLRARTGGDIFIPGINKVVGKISRYKWTNVAIAVNVSEATYDVYIDGELIEENVEIQDKITPDFSTLGMALSSGNAGDLCIDNIRVYDGTEPRDNVEAAQVVSVLPDTKIAIDALNSKVAVGFYSDALHVKGKRIYAKNEVVLDEGDNPFVSEADLNTLFGTQSGFAGKSDIYEGYYDLYRAAEALGYKRAGVDGKCAVFSKNDINISDETMAEVNRYLAFERPTAQEITEKFASVGKDVHPRVIVSHEKVETMKSLYKTDARMKEWGDSIIANAEKALSAESYQYKTSSSNSIQNIDEALDMIMSLGIARWLTGDDKYAARAWKELEVICERDTWNLKKFLDIGELSAIVGIGYDWMYDAFTPEQRTYLETKLYEKGVVNTYKVYYGLLSAKEAYTTWWDNTNNINIVGAGGSMVGAAAIFDKYPDVCSKLIESGLRGITYMMEDYYTYGKCDEGTGYWRYSLSYVAKTVTTFQNTFGTDFGITKAPGLDKTGSYGLNVLGSTGTNGFGDSTSEFLNNPHVMWCASEYNDSRLMTLRLDEMENLGYKGGVDEFVYYDPSLVLNGAELNLDSEQRGIEAVSLREHWYDQGAAYLGFHGGKAKRDHGHLDLGAYVVDLGGERFVIDIGAGDYNADGYFGTKRYNYYPTRTEGHNLYVINPTSDPEDYGMDLSSRAFYDSVRSSKRGAYSILDLTDAYKRDVSSAKRGYMLLDSRRSALVRDEITLKETSDVYWFVHTKADVQIADKNTVYLTQNGVKVKMTIATNAGDYTLDVMDAVPLSTSPKADNPDYSKSGIKKLVLKTKHTGRLDITAKYILADDIAPGNAIYDVPLDSWQCEAGEPDVFPKAEMIYIGGEALNDFAENVKGYSVRLPNSYTSVPAITAVSSGNTVEVQQTSEFGSEAVVKITSGANPALYTIYRLVCTRVPDLKDVAGMTRFPVKAVTASEVPQPENMPENVIDNNFDTRWSAQGDKQWITLELDEIHSIDKIAVAFASGDVRNTIYILEISEDGNTFTEVFNGHSSGTTLEYDFIDIGGKNAKYIRLTGYGNTKNNWNSVTELAALGNK